MTEMQQVQYEKEQLKLNVTAICVCFTYVLHA